MKPDKEHDHHDYRWFSRIKVEHDALDQIFASIEKTLRAMNTSDSKSHDPDLLSDARDDLSFALEEMLDHFGTEEETILLHIRESLPEFEEETKQLERDHEILCQKTSQLRKMLSVPNTEDALLDPNEALKIVTETTDLLSKHNRQEVQLFLNAFERFGPNERRQLSKALENH